MLELLSTILFYSTLIVDLISTVTLCAFTALIFTKVEVSAENAILAKLIFFI